MKKWQEIRNYRRVRNENGQVIANIITIDGIGVEVSEEVFLAYSQMDRQERYQQEQQLVHPQVSLELLSEHEVPIDLYLNEHQISAEENVLNLEEQLENYIKQERLKAAIDSLDGEERQLLQALFFDGFSTRECACQRGVSQRAIIKRRDRILKKLKVFLN